MMDALRRWLAKQLGRFPLRISLVVPFAVLMILTVLAVVFVSVQGGQRTVDLLVVQLLQEVSARVEQRLSTYLAEPHRVNRLNADAFSQGVIAENQLNTMTRYFWYQGQAFPAVGTIAFANDRGEFIGANTVEEYIVLAHAGITEMAIRRYAVGDDGQRLSEVLRESPGYDARQRGWYKTAVDAKAATWTEIEASVTAKRLDVSAVLPVYDEAGTFEGVFVVDVPLSQISDFLGDLQVGEAGQVFVLERSGDLIAASSMAQPFAVEGEAITRIQVLESPDPLMRASAQNIVAQVGELADIQEPARLVFDLEGDRYAVRVAPYSDPFGLDWLTVTVVSESEFAAQMASSMRQTLLLSVVALIVALVAGTLVVQAISQPLLDLNAAAYALARGEWEEPVAMEGQNEIAELTQAFNRMAVQLRELVTGLESRVAARTRDLAQRSAYLEVASEIAHAANAVLDPDELIQQVVMLVQQRFGFYHVGILLLDETRAWAVYRAGSGEVGQAILAEGLRLAVDGPSMVAWSIRNGMPRVAQDVAQETVRIDHPQLKDIQSEAALPLVGRTAEVLGAVTVQSTELGVFDQDTLNVLEIMVDQVAVALENAHLFAESQAALVAEREAYGELSQEVWTRLLQGRSILGYRFDQRGISPVEAQEGEAIVHHDPSVLRLAIRSRDQVYGVVEAHKPEGAGDWTAGEQAVIETVIDQLGVALESARLYQDTQRRAAREQAIRAITDRMQLATDLESLMRITTEEIVRALGGARAYVHMVTTPAMEGESQTSAEGGGDE